MNRMKPLHAVSAIALALSLSACAEDSVIFVTQTQFGIAADSATQTANIGYNRYEGVIAPVYADGEAPPVYAKINSNFSLFTPQAETLYATGGAALSATGSDTKAVPSEKLETTAGKERKVMVFGTGSTWGLHATYRSQALTSMSLGYRRTEASYIPLMESNEAGVDGYGSVLAASKLDLKIETTSAAKLGYGSAIATGKVAEKLGKDNHDKFVAEAAKALAVKCAQTEGDDASSTKFIDYVQAGADTAEKDKRRKEIEEYAKKEAPSVDYAEFLTCEKFRTARESVAKKLTTS